MGGATRHPFSVPSIAVIFVGKIERVSKEVLHQALRNILLPLKDNW